MERIQNLHVYSLPSFYHESDELRSVCDPKAAADLKTLKITSGKVADRRQKVRRVLQRSDLELTSRVRSKIRK